jgi:hypothetical protein
MIRLAPDVLQEINGKFQRGCDAWVDDAVCDRSVFVSAEKTGQGLDRANKKGRKG